MTRRWTGAFLALSLFTVTTMAAASSAEGDIAADATLLRVFLKDGTSLVSYGELARVGDRVVFSMPTAASGADPELHLVNLAADRVDWDRTTRYGDAARASRYLATQAGTDFALLSNEVAQALNDVGETTDSSKRLAIVEKARKMLAEWPPNHFNYKQADVQQMLGMLDETIADLRASAGADRFNLNFVAAVALAPPPEPLLPPPSPRETIEQVLTAANLTDSAVERTTLLTVALNGLDRDAHALPEDWAAAVTISTRAEIARELVTDDSYQRLTKTLLNLAASRARYADVRGLQRLVMQARARDEALGGKRPEMINALLDSLEANLDAARTLRLARDQWALRASAYREYQRSTSISLWRFGRLTSALEDIKALAGSSPQALLRIQRVAKQIQQSVARISPPEELRATHALLVSAAELAVNAVIIRREAALAADMSRAWDASAAAAGSLMLAARARTEIQSMVRIPQLPK